MRGPILLADARRRSALRRLSPCRARRRRISTRGRGGTEFIYAIGKRRSISSMRSLRRRVLQVRFGDERAHAVSERDEAGLARRERAGGVAGAFHALLHALDERGVFGVDLTIDAPVEETRGAHLATALRMHIGDFANHSLRR